MFNKSQKDVEQFKNVLAAQNEARLKEAIDKVVAGIESKVREIVREEFRKVLNGHS